MAYATAACLAVAIPVAHVAEASAHAVEHDGPYTLAVGWAHEPAYVDIANAVQVIVKDAKGNPVDDLAGGDLEVSVGLGGQSLGPLALVPRFDPDTGLGMPGDYEAAIIPTAPGDYTFHLTGTIHGQAVDHSLTAGPTTFDTVVAPRDIEFPVKLPSLSDLATRLDRVSSRVQDVHGTARSAADTAQSLQGVAHLAAALSISGLSLAVAALGLTLVLLWRRSRGPAG